MLQVASTSIENFENVIIVLDESANLQNLNAQLQEGHTNGIGSHISAYITNPNVNTRISDPSIGTLTDLPQFMKDTVKYLKDLSITDPIEILKKLKEDVVTGRTLEIENTSECIEGETNLILVDRKNILQTGLDEISFIPDEKLRMTLEVQFFNENAMDYGGPRKEFFQLLMLEVKEKYFDKGLRQILDKEYITIGKLFALSILQNGRLPSFMNADLLNELFQISDPSSSCIANLRVGLNTLGIYEICKEFPSFIFLFHPTPAVTLNFRKLTSILKPVFSEEGSNQRTFENITYAAFVKYLREVSSGRREPITLNGVLQFVTGAEDEPILGYKLQPSIQFPQVDTSFLPTANTCTICLNLPRPSQLLNKLPNDAELFKLYDYSFSNSFFGRQ